VAARCYRPRRPVRAAPGAAAAAVTRPGSARRAASPQAATVARAAIDLGRAMSHMQL